MCIGFQMVPSSAECDCVRVSELKHRHCALPEWDHVANPPPSDALHHLTSEIISHNFWY